MLRVRRVRLALPVPLARLVLLVRRVTRVTPGQLARLAPLARLDRRVATEPLVVAIGAKPGEAFEPKSWEDFQIAFAEAQARGDDEARSFLAEMLARDPDAWQPAYNAACFEALSGNADAAFEHLARALDLGPARVRELAEDSEDFVSLHADPRWRSVEPRGQA